MRKDVHATYILIGTPPSRYGFDSDPFMEIDEEAARRWEENTGGEAVQERLMLLVSEDELEGMSQVIPHSNLANNLVCGRFEIPILHHRLHRRLQLISGLSHRAHPLSFISGAITKTDNLPWQDADLVCKEQNRVRELDAQDKTGELAKKIGRIISRSVKKVSHVWSVLDGVIRPLWFSEETGQT